MVGNCGVRGTRGQTVRVHGEQLLASSFHSMNLEGRQVGCRYNLFWGGQLEPSCRGSPSEPETPELGPSSAFHLSAFQVAGPRLAAVRSCRWPCSVESSWAAPATVSISQPGNARIALPYLPSLLTLLSPPPLPPPHFLVWLICDTRPHETNSASPVPFFHQPVSPVLVACSRRARSPAFSHLDSPQLLRTEPSHVPIVC